MLPFWWQLILLLVWYESTVTSCARFWEAVPSPSQAFLEWGFCRRPLVLMAVFTTRPITSYNIQNGLINSSAHMMAFVGGSKDSINMSQHGHPQLGVRGLWCRNLCEFGVTRACQISSCCLDAEGSHFWANVRSHSACTAWESNCLSSAKLMEGWKFPKPPRWLTSLRSSETSDLVVSYYVSMICRLTHSQRIVV